MLIKSDGLYRSYPGNDGCVEQIHHRIDMSGIVEADADGLAGRLQASHFEVGDPFDISFAGFDGGHSVRESERPIRANRL